MKNIIIFLFITISFCNAQNLDSNYIIETIDKGDYFYIPDNCFSDGVKGVYYQDKGLTKTNENKRMIKLYWGSDCEDGSYNIIITPEQIFLSSGHNNPNPNSIYWVLNIKEEQYKLIKKGIISKTSSIFQNLSQNYNYSMYVFYDMNYKETFEFPEYWTDSLLKVHDEYCEKQFSKQLNKYFKLLNKFIHDKNLKIHFPKKEELNKFKPKYFSSYYEELKGWIKIGHL